MARFSQLFAIAAFCSSLIFDSANAQVQWEDISPAGVDPCGGGFGFQVLDGGDKAAPKSLYVGTCGLGVYRTTNGGDSWYLASTGQNGDQIASGRNWSLVADWYNPNIVYTVTGFGNRQGIWRSTNGGVDWDQIQHNITQNDISHIEMDPLNHLHLIATEHSGNFDAWESLDSGATWSDKGHPWGSANTFVYFLAQDDNGQPSSTYWLGFAENNGLWRTTNSGANWTQVSTSLSRSHAGAGMYRAANGTLYGSVNATIGRSTDNGRTWVDLRNIGNLPVSADAYAGIVGDGTTIYTMRSNTGHSAQGPYHWTTTPESGDGTVWTDYNSQTLQDGPQSMVFDAVNRVVYASNWCSGVFRLQVGPTATRRPVPAVRITEPKSAGLIYDLRGRQAVASKAFANPQSVGHIAVVKKSSGVAVGFFETR